MAVVGVVVASFSLQLVEPNPCNRRLAAETIRIVEALLACGDTVVLVAQWEVDLALSRRHVPLSGKVLAYESVGQLDDSRYLGTAEVIDAALEVFAAHGVTHFVGIANPFMHQPYIYWLARGHGLKPLWRHVRWIGFDHQSTQWWCRSWWQLLYQTVRLALGSAHGHDGRQEM